MRALEVADRDVGIGRAERVGDLVEADAAGGQRVGVDLHAHGVFLRAEHQHLRDPAQARDALGEQRLGVFVDRRQRQASAS